MDGSLIDEAQIVATMNFLYNNRFNWLLAQANGWEVLLKYTNPTGHPGLASKFGGDSEYGTGDPLFNRTSNHGCDVQGQRSIQHYHYGQGNSGGGPSIQRDIR